MNIQSELLNIQYSDDGKGFNSEEAYDSKSIGLASIQSRVNFLNGNINIDSAPGKGAIYLIEIPTI